MYADIETLYRTTVDRNPDCWMAHDNLGRALADRGQVDEAIAHYRKALEIKPDYAEAHNNLGTGVGRPRTGRRGHRPLPQGPGNQARLRGGPQQPRHRLWPAAGRSTRPSPIIGKALEIKPDYAEAHNNLGNALAGRGQFDEAIAHFRKALEIKPDYVEAHNNLGIVLADRGQVEEAIDHYQQALALALARNDRAKADALRASIRLLLQRAASSGDRP